MGEKPLIATMLNEHNGYVYLAEYSDFNGNILKACVFAKDLESAVSLFRSCVLGAESLLTMSISEAKILIVEVEDED